MLTQIKKPPLLFPFNDDLGKVSSPPKDFTMDPLSVTVSVIAVLQAANSVISICYDFRAAIKVQPWAMTRITNSINELRIILGRLEQVANESELKLDDTSSTRHSALEGLCQDGGAIRNCYEELRALEQKLGSGSWAGKEGSRRRAFIQSIGWQLKGKEAEDMLKRLDGYKTTLNLAITMDQAALMKAMSKTMQDVDENTRSLFKQFQDISLDDWKRRILQWLSPVDPSISHEAALKIRQAGTNNWFLSCKEFENWRDSQNSFLWLSGRPGSGKTILMSSAIHSLQQPSGEKELPLLAYFYCDFRSPETRDPLNLAGSVLAQICFKLGSFPAALDEAFERSKMSASPYGKRTNLGTIIEILVDLSCQHRIVIVVDALDECDSRQDILEFFQKLGTQGSLLNLLVSSRDEIDIWEMLSDFPRLPLEAAWASLDRDIDYYINYRLSHDRDFKWLKQTFKQVIRERLDTQAMGM